MDKDFKFEEIRRRLFDVNMKLAQLSRKEGNPLYEKEIANAREEHAKIKRELAVYLTQKKQNEGGRKR